MSKRQQRTRDLRYNLGKKIMVEATVTFIGEEDSHLMIGGSSVTVDTEALIEAYSDAEDFLDANIDGG